MELNQTTKTILSLLVVIVLSALGYALFSVGYWALLVIDIMVLVIMVIFIARWQGEYINKLRFLVGAIGNRDYMFEFPETKNKRTNGLLNLIKQMLENARNEVVEREAYYELILDQTSGGVVVTNQKGSVILANKSARRILGIDNISHLNNLSHYYSGLSEAFMITQPNAPQTFSLINEREQLRISIQLSTLSRNGTTYKIYAINNISNELEYKELESWNRLTRVLTHEIMNSLTPIITISQSMRQNEKLENPNLRQGLDLICLTSESLIEFVDSYRKLSHVPTPTMMPVQVSEVVGNALKLFDTPANNNIEFCTAIEPQDLMFYVDQTQIGPVVINLLKNAVESLSGAPGRINIEAYSDENENVVLKISDTGPKIPQEVAEQIFVPFFTTKANGNGIGLSLSRQVLRLHNSTIALRQNDSGKSFVLIFK